MTQYWEPGTQYHQGDVVQYEGHNYKNIQPHVAQSDWAPNLTPALWGRAHDEGHSHGSEQHQQPQQWQQPPPQQHQQPNQTSQYGNDKPQHNPNHATEEEKKKKWFDLSDERKKQLEVGGGILAGLGVLGAGYLAYSEHEKNEDEKKAQNWALSNWAHDAETRTQQYYRDGPRGPATWILNKGTSIPPSAIVVSNKNDWTLYICRAFHEGGLQIGKASHIFKKGAVIGYAHKEIPLETYEILVGDMRGLKWVDASGRLNLSALNARPVEGGREANGTPLYIGQAPYNDNVHPGKVSEKLKGCMIPIEGTEKTVENYRVLCYA